MCVQERRAWFSLIVTVSSFALFGLFWLIPHLRPGAMAAFAILALISAEPLVGRRARAQGQVIMDERDQQIGAMAHGAAFGVLWVLFIAAVMIPFFLMGPNAKIIITTSTLSNMVFPALGVLFLIRGLVSIVLYRRQANA